MKRKRTRGNGDGSVFKLSGKRKKPWAVRVTSGYTQDGKQQYRYLGYYENKTQAKNALNEYLVNPLGTIVEKVTLKYVYNSMIEKSKFSDGTIAQYKSGFKKFEHLHNKEIVKITLAELESVFKDKTPSAQSTMKKTLSNCYKYALKHNYVNKDLSEYIEPDKREAKIIKTPFTAVEIEKLWNNLGTNKHDDIVLILLYTGMRISELLEMKTCNVNFEEKYLFVEKSKTKAGIRKIPMHEKIIPLLKARYNPENTFLLAQSKKTRVKYVNYLVYYWNINNHTPHETRHTFITFLNKAGVDDLTVKRLVGHSDKDTTEGYTHRTQFELLEAINKLKYK